MLLRFSLMLGMISATAFAQPISLGIRAGVPISSESSNFPSLAAVVCEPIAALDLACKNDLQANPYAIGPTAELFLPLRLSVEVDALYRHFHQDISEGLIVSRGGALFGERTSAGANGWWFPLLLKYTPIDRTAAPFVTAGATLRHLEPFSGQSLFVNEQEQLVPGSLQIDSERGLDVAITVGAGLRIRAGPLDISPEVRFLHWTSAYYQPAQNQAMLLVGITFPAHK